MRELRAEQLLLDVIIEILHLLHVIKLPRNALVFITHQRWFAGATLTLYSKVKACSTVPSREIFSSTKLARIRLGGALWEWVMALVALACWLYVGFQVLGLDVNGVWRWVCLWGAIVFLLPSLAAVAGLIGWARTSEVLKVSAGFIMFGGLGVGVTVLIGTIIQDVISNMFG